MKSRTKIDEKQKLRKIKKLVIHDELLLIGNDFDWLELDIYFFDSQLFI